MSSTDTQAPMMVRVNITIDQWRQFRAIAATRGITVQELLGQLIREHLAAQKD